jgi:carbon storage regulator CsrA
MLYLMRGLGESVLIGANIRVTVSAVKASRKKEGQVLMIELGVDAPSEVLILREELVRAPERAASER